MVLYVCLQRAPLRLYYTVYESKERQKAAGTITRPQPVTISYNNVVTSEPVVSVDSGKENQETKCVKRKFPDGPGDISPDLELEKKRPLGNENKRKENGAPRKRVKKQVVYDSSMLEAMSESEEQLAKLTLDGDDEGAKANKEKKQTIDCVEKSISLDKTGENGSESYTDNKMKSVDISKGDNTGKQLNTLESVEHITLSHFQPLNVSSKDKSVSNGCVYEFSSEKIDQSEVCKLKVKPGKKKKDCDNSKDMANKLQTNVALNSKCDDISKKFDNNQDGKINSQKKVQTVNKDQSSNKITKKRGRPAGKKVNNTGGDSKETGERVKRKYVRKKLKKDDQSQDSAEKGRDMAVHSDKKQSNVNQSCEKDDKRFANGDYQSELHVNSGAVNKGENVNVGPVYENTSEKKAMEDISETKVSKETGEGKTEMALNSLEAVCEPTTPLYGQTPKVIEETQGLPVSPNPDCADSGAINNGANCDLLNDSKNMSGKNVNKTNDLTKCAYRPVNHIESCGNGYNSGAVNGLGVPVIGSSVSSSHLTPVAFTGYDSCEAVSGNSNGFTGHVQASMAPFSDNHTPLSPMSPPGVCVIAGYQRLTDPHTGHPVTNGFSSMDQNSDQPLDLTNSGHREQEYTKGKIFKTKLLKKNYAKSDSVSNQKEKTNSQTANGLISASWV